MKTHSLTPMQQELLKLFSFDHSEAFALELKNVLTRHLQSKIDEETDKLWDSGILNQSALDEIRTEDLHSYRNSHGKTGARH